MSPTPITELLHPSVSATGQHLRFILASGSQRRRDIMGLAGLTFIVQNGPGGEAEIGPNDEPDARRLTDRNAEIKLKAAIAANRDRVPWNVVIIAADTAVAIDGHPLGKPKDESEAKAMLHELRGRQHDVITSVAMSYAPLRQRGEALSHSVVSQVKMRDYGDDEIDRYIATEVPYDRAGAYGVQDSDFNPARSVHGCYLNVVGLPLCAVRGLLPPEACTFAHAHVYTTCAAHEGGDTS